jgi:RNA polymerase sigma-70 factor (ECF subfamily)
MSSRTDDAELSVELVRRIHAGDSAAWERLYLRYHDPLLFAIRCRLGPRLRARVESEDILHSVIKDALRDLAHFEPRGPGSLAHYLHACVLNKIRGKAAHHAAAGRDRVEGLTETLLERLPQRAVGPEYLDGERFGDLERAMQRLEDVAREVVILRSIEGLSNDETARAIGRTPEATSKIYNRALARLGTAHG